MGPSGSGKTSLLRAIAGLWRAGKGTIRRHIAVDDPSNARRHNESGSTSEVAGDRQLAAARVLDPSRAEAKKGEADRRERGSERRESSSSRGLVFFLPQRPYMVLGTLRQQLLYPTWSSNPTSKGDESFSTMQSIFSTAKGNDKGFPGDEEQAEWKGAQGKCPSDDDLKVVLRRVMLEPLLDRYDGLDSNVDWASVLSLGEQQRLAFGRLLLSPARLALMDESTSALDAENEVRCLP
ncbi:hypothetical protein CBR_g35022 [Chara braunii]|uniref:ABC transporter domain-containing protein n=1 Tax=Chara braunii TaxID=69332 RepID=A0A388LK02_CHABU|nr:hypothetical protein CBR_g35022 [Chara braunii]|eukprot:GBG82656.1 hypothetical protein CBR_g35022 [Chara braunii]